MADKHQVLAIHYEQPTWNSMQIAEELGCSDGYVRATIHRAGRKLPQMTRRWWRRPADVSTAHKNKIVEA